MNNYQIPGKSGLPITFSIDYPTVGDNFPLIIFLHGFKGFKDWGHWPLMAKKLADKGFAVLRMNFSHNGTTPDNPLDFADLNAFGNNTFSKEIQDVQDVMNWIFSTESIYSKCNVEDINLLAHSRGGAVAVITAHEDNRVNRLITLSGVGTLVRYSDEELAHWKKEGVVYMMNGRTHQNMPLYYGLAEDYYQNEARFNIMEIIANVFQPYLVLHAAEDETVPLHEGKKLADAGPSTTLKVIPGANHSFGGGHPFLSKELPKDSLIAVDLIADFLSN